MSVPTRLACMIWCILASARMHFASLRLHRANVRVHSGEYSGASCERSDMRRERRGGDSRIPRTTACEDARAAPRNHSHVALARSDEPARSIACRSRTLGRLSGVIRTPFGRARAIQRSHSHAVRARWGARSSHPCLPLDLYGREVASAKSSSCCTGALAR